ncbi:hypothetical protein G3I42_08410 [Streptomyces sp. SID11385]|nr:hypothetical protein [Streptomyces sp. SID11385]
MSAPPPGPDVAVELAQLRGELSTGLARIEGALALVVERSQRTERDLAALESEVEALKAGRWPLPAVGALTGLAALVVAVWDVLAR